MVVLLKINVNKLMNEAQYTENKKKKRNKYRTGQCAKG